MLTLTDKDLQDLQLLVNDFRHKEATALIQFIVGKQNAAGAAPAKAADEPADAEVVTPPKANGHAEAAATH